MVHDYNVTVAGCCDNTYNWTNDMVLLFMYMCSSNMTIRLYSLFGVWQIILCTYCSPASTVVMMVARGGYLLPSMMPDVRYIPRLMLNISSINRVLASALVCNARSTSRRCMRMPPPEPPKWTGRLLAYLEGRWWLEWREPDCRPSSFLHELQLPHVKKEAKILPRHAW